jgi:hypothetical protein
LDEPAFGHLPIASDRPHVFVTPNVIEKARSELLTKPLQSREIATMLARSLHRTG